MLRQVVHMEFALRTDQLRGVNRRFGGPHARTVPTLSRLPPLALFECSKKRRDVRFDETVRSTHETPVFEGRYSMKVSIDGP